MKKNMKKIILIFTMIRAVAGVQAKKDRLYATFAAVSGNNNITWNIAESTFSISAAGSNTYTMFKFDAGTLSNYSTIYFNITEKTNNVRILFMNGSSPTKTWTLSNAGVKNESLTGTNIGLTTEQIATITEIRIAGPGSGGTVSNPSVIKIDPATTYLEAADDVERMDITTSITSGDGGTYATPFQWYKGSDAVDGSTVTISNFGNNFGKTTSGTIFGYANNNSIDNGHFSLTGYDQEKVTLGAYDGEKSKGIRLLAGEGTNTEITVNQMVTRKALSTTKCTSIKAGQGASNCQNISSIDFIKEFKATSTTAFSIAASAKSTVAYDRSFTAGQKSTVCLPFDLTQEEADAAGTFYEMTAGDASGITFTKVTTGGTTAYKPYIFEAKETGTPFFNITNKEVKASAGATTSYSADGYTFHGTLAKQDVASGAYGYSAGAFKKAGTGVTIKAFRGYITYNGPGFAPALLNINFGDGSETTGISDATRLNNNEEIRNNNVVYNLQGQRVSANHKGIVIKNGRKYVIK